MKGYKVTTPIKILSECTVLLYDIILNTYKIPIKVIKDIWSAGNNQSDNCKREIVKAINKVFYGETLQRFDKIKAHLVRFGITLPESFDKYERKII